jgi:pyridoxine 5-phosphate synthase
VRFAVSRLGVRRLGVHRLGGRLQNCSELGILHKCEPCASLLPPRIQRKPGRWFTRRAPIRNLEVAERTEVAELGVNIDHVATLRQARRTYEPDPVFAAALAELGGADCITIHLREDRRHIQDRDLELLRKTVTVKLNLELACESQVLDIASRVKPDQATLVPERREEVTTEGGLDVAGNRDAVARAVGRLKDAGIFVSLFVDPDERQIEASRDLAADAVELHTGQYALARRGGEQERELITLVQAGAMIRKCGMALHAGHGLNYQNVRPVAIIEGMRELNIGHAIVSRAVMVGMERAVRDMKRLVE